MILATFVYGMEIEHNEFQDTQFGQFGDAAALRCSQGSWNYVVNNLLRVTLISWGREKDILSGYLYAFSPFLNSYYGLSIYF